jgi:hypothetical protein
MLDNYKEILYNKRKILNEFCRIPLYVETKTAYCMQNEPKPHFIECDADYIDDQRESQCGGHKAEAEVCPQGL